MFDSVSSAASIPLTRLTLLFSENGRGKTTLAAILRSLGTGEAIPIAERRRLGAPSLPHVVLDCIGGPPPAIFENGAWNRTLPDLVVFDDVFIEENVHSGLTVQPHHRQSLHELILGAPAVALNADLRRHVERIEQHISELRVLERAISVGDRGPFTLDEFCALPECVDIDERIAAAERSLAAAQAQEAIRLEPAFDLVRTPAFDLTTCQVVLGRDLTTIDAETLARLQAHFEELGNGGEAWVSDGMGRIGDAGTQGNSSCPFCAQDLRESPLIQHYRAYFSEAYTSLKRAVADATRDLVQIHGDDAPAEIERAVRVLVERRQFWVRFCEVPEVFVDTNALTRDWRAARQALIAQLTEKQAAPLERMELTDLTHGLVADYDTHRQGIVELNEHLQTANQAIEVAKHQAAGADVVGLSSDLARLRAMKRRFEPETAAACDLVLQERVAKEATELQRDAARTALDVHRTHVFPGFQEAINRYLGRFNAGFQLGNVEYGNTRGGPTCNYAVVINNTAVQVGTSEPGTGAPSFRNTLSAGDRNTLALAFFFASLDQDARLGQKIVVVDDPISSLDDHRALTTVQMIRGLSERASQVIVLSHNRQFMCRLWERADASVRSAIEVVRDGLGSTLRRWDVAHDAVTEHDRRDARLRSFVRDGGDDLLDVARSLRLHLEAYLRVLCPSAFPPGALLGPFRHRCRQVIGSPNQILDRDALQELDEIVEYAQRFHHHPNAAWISPAINEQELRGYVEHTLRFTGP